MTAVFATGGSSALGLRVLAALSPHFQLLVAAHRRPVRVPEVETELLPDGLERCREYAARIQTAQVVLHLAAATHTSERAEYFHVNTELTKRLLSVCRTGQHFIYVSSQSAHPEGGVYGYSKWLAEEAVRASGLDYTIVRLAEVYGSKDDQGIDLLIAFARRTRLLIDFRNPTSVRYAPIALDEAAEFVTKIVLQPAWARRNYTLCADHSCTALDMARALRYSVRPVCVVPVPVFPLRIIAKLPLPLPFKLDQLDRLVVLKNYDNSAARQDYGFRPKSFLDYLARH